MVDLQVLVAAEHEDVIAAELIRIDHAVSTNILDGEHKQRICQDTRQNIDMDPAHPILDAEQRHFAGFATASIALAPYLEVGLVEYDHVARQGGSTLKVAQDGCVDRAHDPVDSPIENAQLQGHLADRDLQLKEVDQREPLDFAQTAVINPTPREDMERIAAARTSIALIGQFVEIQLSTAGAKSMSIITAFSRQVIASRSLA
mgnify:CR=1 FL=1